MQRLIIDTDPGVDDAQAILLASAHPNTKIEAILSVGGNVGIEHTTRNALAIVEVIDQEIPVYRGCDEPLVYQSENAAWVHGADGLGDSGIEPLSKKIEKEHAVNALIRMINAEPNEFTVVAIGPLTNIGLAVKLDPTLPHKVKRFVVMGGAVTSHGNSSNLAAEFNIYADPEAAYVVFEAWANAEKLIEIVDWEATIRHGIPKDIVKQWRTWETARAKFFNAISNQQNADILNKFGMLAPDPLALAVAVEPSCVKRADSCYVVVETGGTHARGQTIVDWHHQLNKTPNASIILDVDLERFAALFEAGLK